MEEENAVPPAWRGLGVDLPLNATIDEWLQAANLDWEVQKFPQMVIAGGNSIETGSEALIRVYRDRSPTREDVMTILPSDNWHPIQNRDAFKFFSRFCDNSRANMTAAGTLMNGRHVWALAKIEGASITLSSGDVIEPNLLFSNPHYFGTSIEIRLAMHRVISGSYFVLPMRGRIDRGRELDRSIVREVFQEAEPRIENFRVSAETLSSQEYTDDDLIRYANEIFPKTSDRRRDLYHTRGLLIPHSTSARMLVQLIDTHPGALQSPGSWWNAFTVVTYMTDQILGKAHDTRLVSAWYGQYQEVKEKAFSAAVLAADKTN